MSVGKHYALYIDDSGTKEYAESPEQYSCKGGRSKYFVFGGLLATYDSARVFSRRIAELKRATFGTEHVEIKANWLSFIEKRKSKYLDKYSLRDSVLNDFVDNFYQAIAEADLRLFASVVNKEHVQEKYLTPYYTPAIAYEILLQRIVLEIKQPDMVRVVIDDMDGATPKGNQYRENLKRQHGMLLKNGSQLCTSLDFSSLLAKQIFVDSASSHLLQAADTIAFNVNKQFVQYGDEWELIEPDESGKRTLPTYGHFEAVLKKFCQGPGGRIQGYGVVKFPLLKRIPWTIDGEQK